MLIVNSTSFKKAMFCTAVLPAVFLASQGSAATIVADFTGGNSNTVEDGWVGKSGLGWADSWKVSNGGSHSFERTLKSDLTPGGGNYLEMTLTHLGSSTWASMTTFRQYQNYETINVTQAHTVSFEYRLDQALDTGTRLLFFDAQSGGRELNTTGVNPTWAIRHDSNGLALYDGTSPVVQDYALTQGDVYRFTIHISPSANIAQSSYRVEIENLTHSDTVFLSDSLAFYTPQNSVGGYLNFAARVGSEYSTTFSVDSIHVSPAIPEPSSVALIGCLLLGAGIAKGRLFFRSR